jgi:hypothetical protein
MQAARDQEIHVLKCAIKAELEANGRIESQGTIATEDARASDQSRGLLSLLDVKLALLTRIGRAVERVFAEYTSALRALRAEGFELVSGSRAVEADVDLAADALLDALGYSDDRATYDHHRSSAAGDFLYYMLRRSVRHGRLVGPELEHQQPRFYVFNGATYDRSEPHQVSWLAERHLRSVLKALARMRGSHADAAVRLLIKINDERATGLYGVTGVTLAEVFQQMHSRLMDAELLERDGRMCPIYLEHAMDTGDYMGMNNGVYDLSDLRFMPKGTIPRAVLVSMSVDYDYIAETTEPTSETAQTAQTAQIEQFYRTLFADDPNDPNDAGLAQARRFVGSLLDRSKSKRCKQPCVFLGSAMGDNGKTAFVGLLQATLGEYAMWGEKSLMCAHTELPDSSDSGCDCGSLQTIFHPTPAEMPEVCAVVVRFGSTFRAELTQADTTSRIYPRVADIAKRMRELRQRHFLTMVDALREFRMAQ